MKNWFLPRFSPVLLFIALQFLQPISAQETGNNPSRLQLSSPSLPDWTGSDQARMLKGEWIAGAELLPGEDDKPDEIDGIFPIIPDDMAANEDSGLPPIPAEILARYIPSSEEMLLLDPQSVLTEQEQMDIAKVLEEIKEETGVTFYLTMFEKEQKVPAAINAPSLARQIFKGDARSILVEFHKDDLTRSQVVYSENLGFCLDDRKRKELLDAAQRRAAEYTENMDLLWHFLESLGLQVPSIIALAESNPLASKINIPKVEGILPEGREAASPPAPRKKLSESLSETWDQYGMPLVLTLLGLGLAASAIAYLRHRKIYPLAICPVRKRLGTPHGSNTARPVHYSGQKTKSKLEQDLLKDFFNTK